MKITLSKEETLSIIETYVKSNMNITGSISTDSMGNYVIETDLKFGKTKEEEKSPEPVTQTEEPKKEEETVAGILGEPEKKPTNLFD